MWQIPNDYNYYDGIEDLYEMKSLLEEINIEESYIELFIQEHFILKEDIQNINQNKMKWKKIIINQLRTSTINFANFSENQMKQEMPLFQQNKQILTDLNKFPVQNSLTIQNSTNYNLAFQRVVKPINTILPSIDIEKLEEDPKKNLYLKKMLIPEYNNQQDFVQFAKMYFYGGESSRQNLSPQAVQKLIPQALNFVINFQHISTNLQQELKNIMAFINTDPNTNIQQNQNINDINNQQQQIQGQQLQNQGNQKPVTPLGKTNMNPVNAAYSYEEFMLNYFNEAPNPTSMPLIQQNNSNSSHSTNINNNLQTPQQKPIIQQQEQNKQDINQAPISDNMLNQKRIQVAAQIIVDVYNAKLTALSTLARDCIYILKKHIASYTNNA